MLNFSFQASINNKGTPYDRGGPEGSHARRYRAAPHPEPRKAVLRLDSPGRYSCGGQPDCACCPSGALRTSQSSPPISTSGGMGSPGPDDSVRTSCPTGRKLTTPGVSSSSSSHARNAWRRLRSQVRAAEHWPRSGADSSMVGEPDAFFVSGRIGVALSLLYCESWAAVDVARSAARKSLKLGSVRHGHCSAGPVPAQNGSCSSRHSVTPIRNSPNWRAWAVVSGIANERRPANTLSSTIPVFFGVTEYPRGRLARNPLTIAIQELCTSATCTSTPSVATTGPLALRFFMTAPVRWEMAGMPARDAYAMSQPSPRSLRRQRQWPRHI